MACVKDKALFDILDHHTEELRSSSFQVPLKHLHSLLACYWHHAFRTFCSAIRSVIDGRLFLNVS